MIGRPLGIPARVHFIWLSLDAKDLPADVAANVKSWIDKHPGFQIKVWSYSDLQQDFSGEGGKRVLDAMASCRFAAMQADLARLYLVSKHGGFYSDLKNRAKTSFLRELLHPGLTTLVEHAPTVYGYRQRLMNSFFGAVPGDTFINNWLDFACSNVVRRLGTDIAHVTGDGLLLRLVSSYAGTWGKPFRIVRSEKAWGFHSRDVRGWMARTSASYNGPQMVGHWSRLQRETSLYVD